MNNEIAGRMAGRRFEPDTIVELVIHLDQYRLIGIHDRPDTVRIDIGNGAFLTGFFALQPEFQLGLAEDIFCIRECRYPAAIHQPRIPANMIDMQMCAHHEIDLFGLHPGSGKVCQIRVVHLVPHRPRRAFLVIPDTGIHQDRVARCFDNVGLHGDDQIRGRRIDKGREQPVPVCLDHLWRRIRQEGLRIEEWLLTLNHTVQREVANFLHFNFLPQDKTFSGHNIASL